VKSHAGCHGAEAATERRQHEQGAARHGGHDGVGRNAGESVPICPLGLSGRLSAGPCARPTPRSQSVAEQQAGQESESVRGEGAASFPEVFVGFSAQMLGKTRLLPGLVRKMLAIGWARLALPRVDGIWIYSDLGLSGDLGLFGSFCHRGALTELWI
jgi:hypothetical protein